MSLYKLNFTTADKVIDLYAQLLMDGPNQKKHKLDMLAYSDLNGYDIGDLSNSMALMLAYQVKKASSFNEKVLHELKQIAREYSSALAFYNMLFIPDAGKYELEKLNKSDPDYPIQALQIRLKYSEGEAWNVWSELETPDSFLQFCITTIKETPQHYWQLIFNRLQIVCDMSDDSDIISFEVYQESTDENKDMDSEEFIHSKELENADPTVTTNNNRSTLLQLLFVGMYVVSLYSIEIRTIAFALTLISNVVLLIFFFKERPKSAKAKLNFIKAALFTVFLIVGLVDSRIGFYLAFLFLGLQIFDLLKDIRKTYFQQSSTIK